MNKLLICLILLCNVGVPDNYPPQGPKGPNGPSEPRK